MAALPNRTQPSDFFRRYAKEHKLTDRTIKVLQEEDCDQAEVIHFLDRQYIDQLNITVGQKIRMGNIFKKNQKNEVESDPAQVDWTNGMYMYDVLRFSYIYSYICIYYTS